MWTFQRAHISAPARNRYVHQLIRSPRRWRSSKPRCNVGAYNTKNSIFYDSLSEQSYVLVLLQPSTHPHGGRFHRRALFIFSAQQTIDISFDNCLISNCLIFNCSALFIFSVQQTIDISIDQGHRNKGCRKSDGSPKCTNGGAQLPPSEGTSRLPLMAVKQELTD